jgi:hypothetical protein
MYSQGLTNIEEAKEDDAELMKRFQARIDAGEKR